MFVPEALTDGFPVPLVPWVDVAVTVPGLDAYPAAPYPASDLSISPIGVLNP